MALVIARFRPREHRLDAFLEGLREVQAGPALLPEFASGRR